MPQIRFSENPNKKPKRHPVLLGCGLAICVMFLLVIGLVAFAVPQQRPETGEAIQVEVTGGTIEGVEREDRIRVFKGIPFAAPPVGNLRWKAPQPVKAWAGVRHAKDFGPAPMQGGIGIKPSEDCLYLNVWSAAKNATERRPVMVWIYGGGFSGGATSDAIYDGTRFAKKGVVLVSIAYRVGVFGFLAHPELSAEGGKGSGCYGIQDQIAALRWVRNNIAQFGGDPKRVTVFGQSAGGTSVSILTQSPAARGLFQRAICQSGGSMAPFKSSVTEPGGFVRSLPLAEEAGRKFLSSLKVKNIGEARRLSADAVMKGNMGLPWPVADGTTIVGDPFDLYRSGRFNDTPVLVGFNSNDGGFLGPFGPQYKSRDEFETAVRKEYAGGAEAILVAYPHATKEEAVRSSRDLVREALFGWPSFSWAQLQSEKGRNKAYLYYFDFGAPSGEANHGAEVSYVFGNFGGLFKPPASSENRAMSDKMMSYWVNFATGGDPNGRNLPEWPAFDAREIKAMTFGESIESGPTPNREKLKAFDAYWASVREKQRK